MGKAGRLMLIKGNLLNASNSRGFGLMSRSKISPLTSGVILSPCDHTGAVQVNSMADDRVKEIG